MQSANSSGPRGTLLSTPPVLRFALLFTIALASQAARAANLPTVFVNTSATNPGTVYDLTAGSNPLELYLEWGGEPSYLIGN